MNWNLYSIEKIRSSLLFLTILCILSAILIISFCPSWVNFFESLFWSLTSHFLNAIKSELWRNSTEWTEKTLFNLRNYELLIFFNGIWILYEYYCFLEKSQMWELKLSQVDRKHSILRYLKKLYYVSIWDPLYSGDYLAFQIPQDEVVPTGAGHYEFPVAGYGHPYHLGFVDLR